MLKRLFRKISRDGFPSAAKLAVATIRASLDFRYRKAYRRMLAQPDLQKRFATIYDQNLWWSSESGSGQGSEIAFTANLRSWLLAMVPTLGAKTFVDAPCGDFNWMRLVVPQLGVGYVGIDIVESVIAENQRKFGAPNMQFRVGNICEDALPPCDLIMVRDCLFHLSFADIERFLGNLSRTDYKYLLTTTHETRPDFENSDIVSANFRLIDLFKPPFSFDQAQLVDRVMDNPEGVSPRRYMLLLKKPSVPTRLS